MTAKEHNKMAGIFLLAHGGLQGVVMVIICLIYGGIGVAMLAGARRGEEQMVGLVFVIMILVIAFFACIFILPQIIGGFKMLKEGRNARIWGIIGSIVACLSFPFGTAAGVYGLWFLFGDLGNRFYLGGQNHGAFQPPPPPEPNSWQ